jgi:hypothetical protein
MNCDKVMNFLKKNGHGAYSISSMAKEIDLTVDEIKAAIGYTRYFDGFYMKNKVKYINESILHVLKIRKGYCHFTEYPNERKTKMEREAIEDLQLIEMLKVIENSIELEKNLSNLKETILKMEEDNTQIETTNPYVSMINRTIKAIVEMRENFEEITE